MSYSYQKERPAVFTEEGQRMFLSIRDRAKRLTREAGAFTAYKAISGETGSSWQMLACLDRLVELREIIEIGPENSRRAQDRVYMGLVEA